ncbi:MAG: hypothetical protein FWF01_03195 [Alphaproteobacteria bacterium]|nr:hypothetical protein [Alphaproteobacteria bacterium]
MESKQGLNATEKIPPFCSPLNRIGKASDWLEKPLWGGVAILSVAKLLDIPAVPDWLVLTLWGSSLINSGRRIMQNIDLLGGDDRIMAHPITGMSSLMLGMGFMINAFSTKTAYSTRGAVLFGSASVAAFVAAGGVYAIAGRGRTSKAVHAAKAAWGKLTGKAKG